MNYNETNLSITESKLRTLIREEVRAVFVEAKLLSKPATTVVESNRERFINGREWVNVPYSSLLKEFGYQPYTGNLLIKYKSNNRIYTYKNVPRSVALEMYDTFMANGSVGSFVLNRIKGIYATSN